MKEMRVETLAWLATAPMRDGGTVRFRAAPDRVYDALVDARGWTRWFPFMYRAEWVTPSPHTEGSEREVSIRGLGRFRERFLALDPGARFAFAMTASTSPLVHATVEDYRLSPDGAGTRLDWAIGLEPSAVGRVAAPVAKRLVRRMVLRGLRNLDRRLT